MRGRRNDRKKIWRQEMQKPQKQPEAYSEPFQISKMES